MTMWRQNSLNHHLNLVSAMIIMSEPILYIQNLNQWHITIIMTKTEILYNSLLQLRRNSFLVNTNIPYLYREQINIQDHPNKQVLITCAFNYDLLHNIKVGLQWRIHAVDILKRNMKEKMKLSRSFLSTNDTKTCSALCQRSCITSKWYWNYLLQGP